MILSSENFYKNKNTEIIYKLLYWIIPSSSPYSANVDRQFIIFRLKNKTPKSYVSAGNQCPFSQAGEPRNHRKGWQGTEYKIYKDFLPICYQKITCGLS